MILFTIIFSIFISGLVFLNFYRPKQETPKETINRLHKTGVISEKRKETLLKELYLN